MKQTLAMIMLALLVGVGEISAQQTYEFSVAPVGGMRFGDTRFELNFNYLLPDSSIGSGGSELVFPLDVTQAGVQLGFKVMRAGHRLWTADLRLLFAVSDPVGSMIDEDWENMGRVKLLWSHTESAVDASLSDLDFEATRLIAYGPAAELAVMVGVGHQKLRYKMVDLKGWQYRDLDTNGQLEAYLIDYRVLAATYEIRYLRPEIGIVPRLLAGPFLVEFKGVVSPLLYAKDIDNHVLRFFQIRTDGRGFGYSGRLALQYEPPATGKSRFFGRLSGEISRAKVNVAGYREYYATVIEDEYEIKAGTRYAEEHTVSSTQYGVHLVLGVNF